MQRLDVSGAIRPLYGSLGVKGLICTCFFIRVIKANLMLHYLSSDHFVSQLLHVSGMFVAHHQEVYCIYTAIGTRCALSTVYLLMMGYKYARNMQKLTDEIN